MNESPPNSVRARRVVLRVGAAALVVAVLAAAVVRARRDDVPPASTGTASSTSAEAERRPPELEPAGPRLAAARRRRGAASGPGSDPLVTVRDAIDPSVEPAGPGDGDPEVGDAADAEAAAARLGAQPEAGSVEAGSPTAGAEGSSVARPPRARLGRPAAWSADEMVYAVAFAADAKEVLSAGASGVVWVRDRDTGHVVARLEGHTGGVSDLAVSPDGRRALSGGYDQTARLWDLATRQPLRELRPGGGTIYDVAFDREGRRGATAGSLEAVVLWDLDAGTEIRRFPLDGDGNGSDLSADGSRLAAVSSDGRLKVWDIASGVLVGEVGTRHGTADDVVFLPGTDELLTTGGDGMVRLWTRGVPVLVREWKAHDARTSDFALVPDGRTVVTGGWDGRVRAWRISDGARLWDRAVTTALIVGMSVTADGRTVAVASRDGMTRLFDVATGAPVVTTPDALEGHAGAIVGLAFAGGRLVSAGQDATIRVWNVEALAWTRLLRPDGVTATRLASGASDARFLAAGVGRIWSVDVVTGAEIGRVELGDAAVTALAAGRTDDAVLSVVAGQGLCVDAFGDAASKVRVEGRSGALATSPTFALAALVGRDAIELHGLDGASVRKLEVEGVGDRFAAWFPDGRSLLVAHDGGAARVDAETGRVVARYVAEGAVVFVGAVTPDGSGVVLGAEGGALTLHDASSGGIRRRFAGHKTDVTCLVVSADGRTAISGGAEGAIYVWDLVD